MHRTSHSAREGRDRKALLGVAVLTIAVATALGVRTAGAQHAPASLLIDVGDCVELKSPGERLDCYERHAEAAKAAKRSPPEAAPPSAVVTTAPPAASAAQASAPAPAPSAAPQASAPAPAVSAPSPESAPAASREIVATVAELHETVPNSWLITLDNGEVWRQNIPQRFALKPGQHVTLHGTKWGSSYRLTADTLSGFIQVERVR